MQVRYFLLRWFIVSDRIRTNSLIGIIEETYFINSFPPMNFDCYLNFETCYDILILYGIRLANDFPSVLFSIYSVLLFFMYMLMACLEVSRWIVSTQIQCLMIEFVSNLAKKQFHLSFSHLIRHIMLPFLIVLCLFFWSTIRLSRGNQELVLKSFIATCFLIHWWWWRVDHFYVDVPWSFVLEYNYTTSRKKKENIESIMSR
jgi:hypothetical protein